VHKRFPRSPQIKLFIIDPVIGTLVDGLLRNKTARNNLKRACGALDIMKHSPPVSLSTFCKQSRRKRHAMRLPPDIVRRLIDEGLSKGEVKLVAARAKTASGDVPYDAALALDDRRLFYWLSTPVGAIRTPMQSRLWP
jgi:hypothetical protein